MPLLPEAGPLGSGLRVKGVMVLCFCQPAVVLFPLSLDI